MLYLVKSGKIPAMTEKQKQVRYEDQFQARVELARTGARASAGPHYDRPEMAKALGVPLDRYTRYESRHMMPLYLIPKFCKLTSVTVSWLITGVTELPEAPPARIETA